MFIDMLKQKLVFIMLSFLLIGLSQRAFAQLEKIEKNVDKKIETSKKQTQTGKTTPKPEEKNPTPAQQNTNGDGRAIFSYDPEVDDDFGFANSGGIAIPKEDEESDLPDPQRILDTSAFIVRMNAVKRRDMLRYRDGLKGLSPIINTQKYDKKHTLKKEVKVFGWHPHWMKNAYESYNFSLLSMIAYFSYEVNPADGNYRTIHDWESTELITKAQAEGVKVLLSVSNFGEKNNETFLNSRTAQRNCINQVIALLQKRKADGVHLDFENIPEKQSENFTNFVLDMTSQIKASIPGGMVTVSVPTVDFKRVINLSQLKNQVDFFIMGGYEFYGSNSQTAGPIAPVSGGSYWWQFGLEDAVDDYLAAGIDPGKLILTIPYYGAEWVTESLQIPSAAKKFVDYPMYRDVMRKRLNPLNEPTSMSAYITYRDQNNNYRQIWFEDSTSLAQKYAWIQSKKIGGAAIWALGYDNGSTDLWEALAGQFATPVAKGKSSVGNTSWIRRMLMPIMRISRNPALLLQNPRYLMTLFGSLFGVSMIGFLVLYRYGCRMKRSFNLGMKGILALVLLCLLIVVIMSVGNFDSTYLKAAAFLIGGFIIGAIVFLFLSRRFIVERDLP
jgi:spore germination protein YaaH